MVAWMAGRISIFRESEAETILLRIKEARAIVPITDSFLNVCHYFYRIWLCIGCGSKAKTGGIGMILRRHGERDSGTRIISTHYAMKSFDGSRI